MHALVIYSPPPPPPLPLPRPCRWIPACQVRVRPARPSGQPGLPVSPDWPSATLNFLFIISLDTPSKIFIDRDQGLYSLGLISLGNKKKEPEMKAPNCKARARDDRREWSPYSPIRGEAPPTLGHASQLKHNTLVTLGTSHLYRTARSAFRTKGASPYVHARAVFYDVYHAGNTVRRGGGTACIP